MEPYSSDDIKRKKRKNGYGLDKFLRAIPKVTSALIVSTEGLPIAYRLPQGTDETKVAAMIAALHSLSERAIIEMGKGDFDQLYIKGREGYLVVSQAGPGAVMAVTTTKDVRLTRFGLDDDDYDEDDEGDDNFPYPYIYKPPNPPGAPGTVTQLQVKKSTEKKPKNEIVCQSCGLTLTEEERVSHNCRKKPK
jgi:predicted regulator of Ras-like GTPase activity (Roadblock/LC7/MglB family)